MNKISFSDKLERIATRSPLRSKIGALVILKFTFNSFATTFANVVFPRPGGPNNKR